MTTLYHRETGAAHKCEPIDAREILAAKDSQYVASDPKAPVLEGPPAAAVALSFPEGIPEEIDLGPKKIARAAYVAGACEAAGLTPELWNRLAVKARDKYLGTYLETAKAQAAVALAATLTK